MIRPNRRILESLVALRGTPAGDAIMEWVADSRREVQEQLEVATPIQTPVLQGYCQALRDVLGHSESAKDALFKTGRGSNANESRQSY